MEATSRKSQEHTLDNSQSYVIFSFKESTCRLTRKNCFFFFLLPRSTAGTKFSPTLLITPDKITLTSADSLFLRSVNRGTAPTVKHGTQKLKTEDRRPKTEHRRPNTEGRRPKTEHRRPKTDWICGRPVILSLDFSPLGSGVWKWSFKPQAFLMYVENLKWALFIKVSGQITSDTL